jgi:hypothetical protein
MELKVIAHRGIIVLLLCFIESRGMNIETYSIPTREDELLYVSSTYQIKPAIVSSKENFPDLQFWISKHTTGDPASRSASDSMKLRISSYSANNEKTYHLLQSQSEMSYQQSTFLCDGMNKEGWFVAAVGLQARKDDINKIDHSILYANRFSPQEQHNYWGMQVPGEIMSLMLHSDKNTCAYSYRKKNDENDDENYFCTIDIKTKVTHSALVPGEIKRIVFNGTDYIGVSQSGNILVWRCYNGAVTYNVKMYSFTLTEVTIHDIALHNDTMLLLDNKGNFYESNNVKSFHKLKLTENSIDINKVVRISCDDTAIYVVCRKSDGEDLRGGSIIKVTRCNDYEQDTMELSKSVATSTYDFTKIEVQGNRFYGITRLMAIPFFFLFLAILYKYMG